MSWGIKRQSKHLIILYNMTWLTGIADINVFVLLNWQ